MFLLFELLFFGLKLFVDFVHLSPLLEKLGGWGNGLILVEDWKLNVLLHD